MEISVRVDSSAWAHAIVRALSDADLGGVLLISDLA